MENVKEQVCLRCKVLCFRVVWKLAGNVNVFLSLFRDLCFSGDGLKQYTEYQSRVHRIWMADETQDPTVGGTLWNQDGQSVC